MSPGRTLLNTKYDPGENRTHCLYTSFVVRIRSFTILSEISFWSIIPAQLRPAPHRNAIAQQRSAVQCRALRCPAVPCSSAQQRTAALAQQNAAPCGAALCHASPCCVLCGTFTSSYVPVTLEVSYHVPVLLISLYILRCWITNNAPPAQVSPAIYSSAVQHGIVRCRALLFVLRCCVVRRCAFF